jgi:protein-S-isoprenylcysteine O-methyltransferase Ste14
MSTSNESDLPQNNYYPFLLGILNFGLLLMVAWSLMSPSVELWDFIFVSVGVYLTVKFIRLINKAHDEPLTRIRPQDRDAIPKEGIYSKIRHPFAAGAVYMNIAYVFFFRSLLLIPIIPVFAALWYFYAKMEEKIMLDKFGDEYREYMRGTGMLRGAGLDQQRLASSGYGMY